jgi:exosortase
LNVKVLSTKADRESLLLMAGIGFAILLIYWGFFRSIWFVWVKNTEFSYGALVPPLIGYLLWLRREKLRSIEKMGWTPAILGVIAGCGLQVLASFSGTLILSGVSLAVTLVAGVGFLWGRALLRVVILPLSMTVLMVPVPVYVADELTWRLQIAASAASSVILRFLGVPVFQDGNLLRLANYVLEVKEACSGSRSLFALLGLALVLGLTAEKRWWVRISLICAAPLLSLAANLVRIVGTGVIAHQWGNVAANESLHSAWGILVFLMAVIGLLGVHRFLRWLSNENALQY